MTNMRDRGIGIAVLAALAVGGAAQTIDVRVNGGEVPFPNALPKMVNGRVLVPLRGVFEAMGATVGWDPSSQTVTASGNGRTVKVQIGSRDASVNGRVVAMDVAPEISEDTTMVPLRFLSESLGARVQWQPDQERVAITTGEDRLGPADRSVRAEVLTGHTDRQPRNSDALLVRRDSVIPMRLDETISSDHSRAGDRFTATVRGESGRYFEFPDGAVVEGIVRRAEPARGQHAGVLDIRFTDLKLPDGSSYPISGYATNLDDKRISRSRDGRFVARQSNGKVVRDAEIGAGAGLLLGSVRGRALGGAVAGGAIGAIVGALENHRGQNVSLRRDMRLALVLDRDLSIDRRDLRQ